MGGAHRARCIQGCMQRGCKCARKFLPRKLLLMLYYTLVYPYLTYCNVVWGVASDIHITKLAKIQKRAIRVVSGSAYSEHTLPLFINLKVLPLGKLHIFLTAQFMFRAKYHLLPESCMHLVTTAQRDRVYQMRSINHFVPLTCRTNISQRCIGYFGPIIWNRLPVHLQMITSYGVFTHQLRLHLLTCCNTLPN